MPVRKVTWFGACLALLITFTPAFGQLKEQEVGFVEAYAPADAALTLRRGDQIVPVRMGARILPGDLIRLVQPDERVVLRLMDRPRPVTVTAAQGEYAVPAAPKAHGLLDGAWDSILDTLNRLDSPERALASAANRSRASELEVPLLASPQTLVAGKWPLAIAWLPERLTVGITVRRPDGTPIITDAKGSRGTWTSEPVEFTPGDYAITITPVSGNPVTRSIRVVAADAVPEIPAELTREVLPPAMRALGSAIFLAMTAPEWRLEAFQRVAPYTRSFAPAERLFRTLAEGGALK